MDSLDRRRFLELLALTSGGVALAALSGCGDGATAVDLLDGGVPDAAPAGLDVPFGVWRAMLDGVRQSPDHLAARADALVEAGDPAALHAFVRDAIRLLPDTTNETQEATETLVRWGPRGALRSGSGTARTKAELLAELYRRAGLEAAVVAGPVDLRGAPARALFLAGDAPVFAPGFDEAQVAEWGRLLGAPPTEAVPEPDDDGASAALGEALIAAIPSNWYGRARRIGSRLRRVPLVAVTLDGATRYANPVLPDVPFGEAGTDAPPTPAAEATTDPVEITLGYTRSDTGDTIQPLVSRAWSAAEVVGRQVEVQLVPALDFETLVHTNFDAVDLFAATLAVRGSDVDGATGAALLATGDLIALTGERVRRDPETGAVTVDDEPLDLPEEDAPDQLARVVSLGVTVSGSSYPRVGVRVRALDADGLSVPALTAAAFRVEEEDTPRRPLLTTSLSAPPRMLFILDVSVSVPRAFRAEGAAAIVAEVARQIVAEVPDAQFRAASLISGFRLYGGWTSDPDTLQRDALGAKSTSSHLWMAASEGPRQRPTVIVMMTDGHATDSPNDERLRRIIAGPPVVGIHVTESERGAEFLTGLAELTDGAYYRVDEPEEAVAGIVAFLDIDRQTRYRLRYQALDAGPEVRRVRVSTADGRLSAEGTYRVPVPAQRTPRPFLTGLFLTVTCSGRSVTRTLAGFDGSGRFEAPDAEGVHAEIRDQFYGTTLVSFEGGAPTPAAWLDDLLTARLSQEPLFRALEANDLDAARRHAATIGVRSVPPEIVVAHPPIERTPDALTYETGLRAVRLSQRPNFDRGTLDEQIDLLPLTHYATVADDATHGFQTTVRRTARLAVYEAARYPETTLSLLAGAPLVPYPSGTRNLPGGIAANRARWARLTPRSGTFHRLVPEAGEPFAWWELHEIVGSLQGILADGSGGGRRQQQIEAVKRFFSRLELYYKVTGAGPPGIGLLIAYASALAGLYGTAAIVITTLSAGNADEAVRREIATLACNALTGIFPILPKSVDWASAIIGALTGTSLCSAIVGAAS